jgi:hypothetical protein
MSFELSTTHPQHELIDIDDPIRALNQFRPEVFEQVSTTEQSSPAERSSPIAQTAPWPRARFQATPARPSIERAGLANSTFDLSDLDLRPFDATRIEPSRSKGIRMAVLLGVCVGCVGWYALLHSDDLKSIFPSKLASNEYHPRPIAAVTLPLVAASLIDSQPGVSIHSDRAPSAGSTFIPWRATGSTGTAPAWSGSTGVLIVDSHPFGATVFLDGEAVGQTPAVLQQIGVGNHVIRLALSDHQDWSSPVKVLPGEQNRVTASLEEVQPTER